jgi:hypothetical protein
MPPDERRHAFLEKLRGYRRGLSRSNMTPGNLLPATALAYRHARRLAAGTRDWLIARFHLFTEQSTVPAESYDAGQVRYFAGAYGKDVIFVHIPDRFELHDGVEASGIAARAAIREAGAKLFDGFERCGLTVSDFHVNDIHPNSAGYAKIAECVREAAKEIM